MTLAHMEADVGRSFRRQPLRCGRDKAEGPTPDISVYLLYEYHGVDFSGLSARIFLSSSFVFT